VSGTPVEGGSLTSTAGTWSGSPALSRSWRRCDAAGAACAPIPGATGASYTPTAADVGSRLRVRVTATQGRTVSSDSGASGIVVTGPDVDPPGGSVRLRSRNLRKALKTGRIPVRVTCDERCTAVVGLRIGKKLARQLGLEKQVRIARARGVLSAGRARILRAKLGRRARRALRTRRVLRVRIAARLTDTAGNSAPLARRSALRRPRG
jgi:hypothetical protein